jgi:glycine/D-amino acid oxidase-like deaminating enzyme
VAESVDCVVIGAGVVGLACARELALAGHEVVMLEAAGAIGTETSSRNSEVIHAGIYYSPGSAKAALCVQGRTLLYRYCEEHGVAHLRCGKLIVATTQEQIAALHRILAQAAANSVDDLRLLTADEAHAMEPKLRSVAALHSPSTGIIDSHGLMLAYQGDSEARGGAIALDRSQELPARPLRATAIRPIPPANGLAPGRQPPADPRRSGVHHCPCDPAAAESGSASSSALLSTTVSGCARPQAAASR